MSTSGTAVLQSELLFDWDQPKRQHRITGCKHRHMLRLRVRHTCARSTRVAFVTSILNYSLISVSGKKRLQKQYVCRCAESLEESANRTSRLVGNEWNEWINNNLSLSLSHTHTTTTTQALSPPPPPLVPLDIESPAKMGNKLHHSEWRESKSALYAWNTPTWETVLRRLCFDL